MGPADLQAADEEGEENQDEAEGSAEGGGEEVRRKEACTEWCAISQIMLGYEHRMLRTEWIKL